jgi:hypothetical protein
MIIEHIDVNGFEAAFRGMRNAMNSWDRSDSYFDYRGMFQKAGEEDLKLACSLISKGSEHRKFLRVITVSFDIACPRYVWQELDTYKVSTVRLSCSTMNKLGGSELSTRDFQGGEVDSLVLLELNRKSKLYESTKNYEYVREMKKMMPEGYIQRATYHMSYETALSMYLQRKNHRLPEWNVKFDGSICQMIRGLPYMERFIDAAESIITKRSDRKKAVEGLDNVVDFCNEMGVSRSLSDSDYKEAFEKIKTGLRTIRRKLV